MATQTFGITAFFICRRAKGYYLVTAHPPTCTALAQIARQSGIPLEKYRPRKVHWLVDRDTLHCANRSHSTHQVLTLYVVIRSINDRHPPIIRWPPALTATFNSHTRKHHGSVLFLSFLARILKYCILSYEIYDLDIHCLTLYYCQKPPSGTLGGSPVLSSRTLSTAYSLLAKTLVATVPSETSNGGAVYRRLGNGRYYAN